MISILENIGKDVEGATNVYQVLQRAGLDFSVKGENCYYMYNGMLELVPGVQANVREDTGDILGVVSNRYRICQNEEAFDFINYISNDIKFRKAGMTKNGIIYIIAELKPSMYLKEEYKNYVIFRNAHNGKFPLQATISPMRVVCENQFHSVFSRSENNVYIKHVSGLESKLEMAKQVLKGYADAVSMMDKKISAFATTKFTQNQFTMFVNTVFPITSDMTEGAIEKQKEIHNILKYLYEMEDNQNYGGTLLGALNATTYYDSHRDEMYFKKSIVTDDMFFRQLDGEQLSDKLLKYV